jgi:hypothetical protein
VGRTCAGSSVGELRARGSCTRRLKQMMVRGPPPLRVSTTPGASIQLGSASCSRGIRVHEGRRGARARREGKGSRGAAPGASGRDAMVGCVGAHATTAAAWHQPYPTCYGSPMCCTWARHVGAHLVALRHVVAIDVVGRHVREAR